MKVKKEYIEMDRETPRLTMPFSVAEQMAPRIAEMKNPHVAGAVFAKMTNGRTLSIALLMDEKMYETHIFNQQNVTDMKEMFLDLLTSMFGEKLVIEAALMQMVQQIAAAVNERDVPPSHNGN